MSLTCSSAALSNCFNFQNHSNSMFFYSRPITQRNHRKSIHVFARPAMNLHNMDVNKPCYKNLKVKNSVSDPSGGPAGIPNIPLWAKLVLGSIICLAIPFYKKVLSIEERVEKTSMRAIEAVEKVAETVEKVAEDIEESLPKNSKLKQEIVELENLAKRVDKDAKQVEEFIKKAEHITEEVEDLIDSTSSKEVSENVKKKTLEKKGKNSSE